MFISGLFPHGRAVLGVVCPWVIPWVVPLKTSAGIALDPGEWIFMEFQMGLGWNRPNFFPIPSPKMGTSSTIPGCWNS